MSNLPSTTLFDPVTMFAERGPDGLVRIYDVMTGAVVSIVGQKAVIDRMPVETVEITRADGSKVRVQKGIQIDDDALGIRAQQFDPLLGELICSRIANGESLKKILEDRGMPSYSVIGRWRRNNHDFDRAMQTAHEDHADYCADRVIEVAEDAKENCYDSDSMTRIKHLTDMLKYRAQIHKPQKYSPNVKISGDPNAPLQVIFETGVRKPGDPGFYRDETKTAQEIATNVISIEGKKDAD